MKSYVLNIECMREEGCGAIVEMFSKGHHEELKFKKACKDVYADECDENNEDKPMDCPFIDNAKLYHKWGKIVGMFEDGERIGWTLSESKEYKKGYFPITKINI